MPKLRFAAALAVVAAIAAPRAAHAVALFSDDVAVQLDGHLRLMYEHSIETDADETRRPGTINRFSPDLSLAPELWLNEYVAVRTRLDVDGPTVDLGAAGDRFGFDEQAGPMGLRVSRANLYWQTPLGTLEAGRLGWHWGLGLFQHDGRDDLDRYGVSELDGAMDTVKMTFAPAGLAVPLDMTVFFRVWFAGAQVPGSGHADNGYSYGLAVRGRPERADAGLLLRYDVHKDGGTELFWVDGYGTARLGIVELGGEAGTRWGRSTTMTLVDPTSLTARTGQGNWWTWGGVAHVRFPGWRAGPVVFETTGLEGGILSGNGLDGLYTDDHWATQYAARDYRVGLLLLPRLLPARQAALAAQLRDALVARLGAFDAELQETADARTNDAMGNVWFVQPGFGLRTDDDLRFRLNVLYAAAAEPLPTFEVVDDGGTAQRADDRYAHERSYGFELDVHLSYPFWGGVTGVLEAGIGFPGGAFDDASGDRAPVPFVLLPRLTASF